MAKKKAAKKAAKKKASARKSAQKLGRRAAAGAAKLAAMARTVSELVYRCLAQVFAAVCEDIAAGSFHRPSKEATERRLAEIATGRCPRCGARLYVSHGMQYLACENQYDPQNTLNLHGSGDCQRMITSLEILRTETKRHGLEMPVL